MSKTKKAELTHYPTTSELIRKMKGPVQVIQRQPHVVNTPMGKAIVTKDIEIRASGHYRKKRPINVTPQTKGKRKFLSRIFGLFRKRE